MQLNDPITVLSGIGEKTAALYHKINIYTIHDLITHYPRDYEEWRDIVKIGELSVNSVHAIHATVISAPQTIRRRMPWTEKPGGLQSIGSQRIEQD